MAPPPLSFYKAITSLIMDSHITFLLTSQIISSESSGGILIKKWFAITNIFFIAIILLGSFIILID